MLKTTFISIISSLIVSMVFTFTYNKLYQKKYAILKIRDAINAPLQKIKDKNISKEQLNFISTNYAENLKKKIKEIELRDNVIFLIAPAVISELPDYTNLIIEETMSDFEYISSLKK